MVRAGREGAVAAWTVTGRPFSEREPLPRKARPPWTPARPGKVIDEDRGKLPLHELLRCRLRYLTDGYVLGSEAFVKEAAKPLEGLRKKPVRPKPAGTPRGPRGFPGNARTAGVGVREQAAESSNIRPELVQPPGPSGSPPCPPRSLSCP